MFYNVLNIVKDFTFRRTYKYKCNWTVTMQKRVHRQHDYLILSVACFRLCHIYMQFKKIVESPKSSKAVKAIAVRNSVQ